MVVGGERGCLEFAGYFDLIFLIFLGSKIGQQNGQNLVGQPDHRMDQSGIMEGRRMVTWKLSSRCILRNRKDWTLMVNTILGLKELGTLPR